jgi:TetR/AcrR family transcriptional regulator, cholesterol catabolism regulator
VSARREAIVKAAGDIFAAKGFIGTTVREITDEAGILSGSLYHHFDSKEALALEVVLGYYETMLQNFRTIAESGDGPTDMFVELIEVSCAGIKQSPGAVGLILNSGDYLLTLPRFSEVAAMNTQMRQIWVDVIESGTAKGQWTADLDPVLVYLSVRDVLAGAIRWWENDGLYSIEQLAERFSDMLLYGIGAPGAKQ